MPERRILSRDEFLAQQLQTEEVPIKEWDATVLVRALSSEERDIFRKSIMRKEGDDYSVDMTNITAKLCVLSIVDTQGNRVFDDSDAEALGKKSGAVLGKIFDVAQRLSGLSKEHLEDLVKNSAPAPAVASPTV